jgi:hypothetical protein
MQTEKLSNAPLLPLFQAWFNHRRKLLMASLKPCYAAEDIARLVAGGGNPAGV